MFFNGFIERIQYEPLSLKSEYYCLLKSDGIIFLLLQVKNIN